VTHNGESWTDERIARIIATLLRLGVTCAAALVLLGGGIYLVRHGLEPASYRVFHGEPPAYRSLAGVIGGALHLGGRALIQLGLLLLIATPIARVVFATIAFALERDRTYVLICLIVLATLGLGLGAGGP
jgi:uncharacterized membrane protein